jgi:hypothetical protein
MYTVELFINLKLQNTTSTNNNHELIHEPLIWIEMKN